MKNSKRLALEITRLSCSCPWMYRAVQSCVFVSVLCVTACASQPPLIADPPQHAHTPPEIVPWEEEYSRSRPKPEVFNEVPSDKDAQAFHGDDVEPAEKESGGALQVIADVIAFPFRGVGWLLQQVF
jgi:hypothetical protein